MASSSCSNIPAKKLCSDAVADAADLLLQLATAVGELAGREEEAAAVAEEEEREEDDDEEEGNEEAMEVRNNLITSRCNTPAASQTYRSPSFAVGCKRNATAVGTALSSPLNDCSAATNSPLPLLTASIKHCRRRRSPTFELRGTAQADTPSKTLHEIAEASSKKQNHVLVKKDYAGDEAAGHEYSSLNVLGVNSTEKPGLVTSSTSYGNGRLRKIASDNAVTRPHPLRATVMLDSSAAVSSNSHHMNPRALLKFMFDREYESLLRWRKSGFQAFTEEVQETLGAILKQSVREYKEELEVQLKYSIYHNVNAGAGQCTNVSYKNNALDENTHRLAHNTDGEIGRMSCYDNSCELSPADHNTNSCKLSTPCSDAISSPFRTQYDDYCVRHLSDPPCTGAAHEEYYRSTNHPLQLDQKITKAAPHELSLSTRKRSFSCADGGAMADNLVQNSNDPEESASTLLYSSDTKEKSLEAKLVCSLSKAMNAVVSVREAAQRIETHRSWMNGELNLTRLELMKLRFSGSYSIKDDDMDHHHSRHGSTAKTINKTDRKDVNLSTLYSCEHEAHSRAVLREAMDLSDTVHAFVMELSSALAQNEHGVPWPLSHTADCSDVTPQFIDKLAGLIPTTDRRIN